MFGSKFAALNLVTDRLFTGYYKPSATDVYTEDSAGGDFDFMSKMVSDWEAAGKSVTATNVRHTIVRIGERKANRLFTVQKVFSTLCISTPPKRQSSTSPEKT